MPIDQDLLLVIRSSGLGEGEPDLGEKLLQGFLKTLLESGTLPARIICMNSGVFLTTECTAVLDTMRAYADRGCEILSCGTCLAYYGREDKLAVGRSTNMKETVSSLLSFRKILQP